MVVAAAALLSAVSACTTFAPVYSSRIGTEQVAISYASPTSRIEQIIYQDLALRLGRNRPGAPLLTVNASQASVTLADDSALPQSQRRMTVSANIVLTDAGGTPIFTGTRSATADYASGPQVVANSQAESDAAARAAHQLADTIRLVVLGALRK